MGVLLNNIDDIQREINNTAVCRTIVTTIEKTRKRIRDANSKFGGKLFGDVKDGSYIFHKGGLNEPQFNIAWHGGFIRVGIALSFQPNQSLPNPLSRLSKYVEQFIKLPIENVSGIGDLFFGDIGDDPRITFHYPSKPNLGDFWFYGFIFDEPTTGVDIDKISKALEYLINTWINLMEQGKMSIEKSKKISKYIELLNFSKQIILSGPPGTSKTWQAKRLTAKLLEIDVSEVNKEEENQENEFSKAQFSKDPNESAWAIVQFHPAYNYEDFVRGIQISTSKTSSSLEYNTINRIFSQMALAAFKNEDKKYVLIIDEINRAHLAAVLGELIYALEYRGSKINSPYAIDNITQQFDNESNTIIVPPNLYIIGTMNTADRSIGHIDYAVRRRFAFVPLLPDENVLENYYKANPTYKHSIKAKALFKAVAALFNNCLSPEFHADDVQPGHTYFMAKTCQQLANKFIYQVYPLLREYVKDGILVINNIEVIPGVTIEPAISLTDLETSIIHYLNCENNQVAITEANNTHIDVESNRDNSYTSAESQDQERP